MTFNISDSPATNGGRRSAATELLYAMEGVVYRLDRRRRLIAFGQRFEAFATDNGAPGLADRGLMFGRNIFDFISGEKVRDAYRRLFDLVEAGCLDCGIVMFRCDGPEVERHMRMAITQVSGGGFLCQSIISHEQIRPPIGLFDFHSHVEAARADPNLPLLGICSMCQQVRFPAGSQEGTGEWIAAEEYYAKGGSAAVALTHTFCPPCSRRWQEEWLGV